MSPSVGALSLETQSGLMGAAASLVWAAASLLHRQAGGAWRLALLALLHGAWAGAHGLAASGVAGARPVSVAALWLLAPACMSLAANLAGRGGTQRRWLAAAWVLGALGAASALALPDAPALGAQLWGAAGAIAGAVIVARPIEPELSGEHVRLRYLAVAHGLATAGVLGDSLLWLLGLPRILTSLAPQLYLYVSYLHIARVRIADLRVLVGNAAALTATALGIAAVFWAIRIQVGERLDLFAFNAFVASFALLIAFGTVRRVAQDWIARIFVADRVALQRALRGVSDRLAHLLTLDEILSELLAALESSSRLQTASVFLRDDRHLGFQQAGSLGLPPRARVSLMRDPVWVEALEQSDVLVDADLAKAHDEARHPDDVERLAVLRRTMRDLDAQIVLPLRTDETTLVGFWTLRDERSEESLSSAEIELLREVSDKLALAIRDSRTFEQLRARDRLVALGEMASGLAHEIRNPLATIRGSLALLEDSEHSHEDAAVFRQVVVDEIRRLDRVVETFLDYSRPTARSAPIKDVGHFVRTCIGTVARDEAQPDVHLEVDVEKGLPELEADAALLERVIANVVHNAYQALEGSGRIRIAARSEPTTDLRDAWIEISVTDDGPGMDEETLDRAFVPFFTTRPAGTGLGLALCERLMRAQGGTIELRSVEGAGTTVLIRLPCSPPEASS